MNPYQQAINVACESSYVDEDNIPPVIADTWYSNLILSVSEDAQILAEIAISVPFELATSSYSMCQRLEQLMHKNYDWSQIKTKKAYKEIKRYLHETK